MLCFFGNWMLIKWGCAPSLLSRIRLSGQLIG